MDSATAELYTLSLHDALPIFAHEFLDQPLELGVEELRHALLVATDALRQLGRLAVAEDRKSTRLNSSHVRISYAVFCSKKHTTVSGRLPMPGPDPLTYTAVCH